MPNLPLIPDKDAKKLTNYRELNFPANGKGIVISGMANPKSYNNGNSVNDLVNTLAQKYTVLISFASDCADIGKVFEKNSDTHKHYNIVVIDFTAPSLEQFEELYTIVSSAERSNENVAMHCGEGFGRTGTMMASLVLQRKFAMLSEEELESLVNYQAVMTTTIYMGHYNTPGGKHLDVAACTERVRDSITDVRSAEIRGSNTNGLSVENLAQVKELCELEKYLVWKYLRKYAYPSMLTSLGIYREQEKWFAEPNLLAATTTIRPNLQIAAQSSEFNKVTRRERLGCHIVFTKGDGTCGPRSAILTMILMARAALIQGDPSYLGKVKNLLKEVFAKFHIDRRLQRIFKNMDTIKRQSLFNEFINNITNPLISIDFITQQYAPYRDALGNTENKPITDTQTDAYQHIHLLTLLSECLRFSIHDYAISEAKKMGTETSDKVELDDFNAPYKYVTMDKYAKLYFKHNGFHCVSAQVHTARSATEVGSVDPVFLQRLNEEVFRAALIEQKENEFSFIVLNNGVGHIEGLLPNESYLVLTTNLLNAVNQEHQANPSLTQAQQPLKQPPIFKNHNFLINYRELEFSFNKHKIVVSGMAHPLFHGNNDEGEDALDIINKRFQTIISLEGQGLHDVKNKFLQKNESNKSNAIIIEDFHTPTPEQFEEFYNIIIQEAALNRNVLVHCASGHGRTGTMLASLALRELLETKFLNNPEEFAHYNLGLSETLTPDQIKVSSAVLWAIKKIRDIPLKVSFHEGIAIESEMQVQGLLALETKLVQNYQDKYNGQALAKALIEDFKKRYCELTLDLEQLKKQQQPAIINSQSSDNSIKRILTWIKNNILTPVISWLLNNIFTPAISWFQRNVFRHENTEVYPAEKNSKQIDESIAELANKISALEKSWKEIMNSPNKDAALCNAIEHLPVKKTMIFTRETEALNEARKYLNSNNDVERAFVRKSGGPTANNLL